MSRTWDAAIAGAGPGGSALAIRLARAGLRVVVVDRAVFPRPKPCSEYMSPESVRQLAALGALEAVEAAGHPVRGTMVAAPRGARLTGLFARAGYAPFRATGLSVPRTALDLALLDAARRAGATVLEATPVRGVLRRERRIAGLQVAPAAGPRELPARLTVGADGIRSVVARALGPVRAGPLRRYGVVAHAEGIAGLSDVAEMHVRDDGYVGLNPLRDGLASIGLVLPEPAMAAARGRPLSAFLAEALARFPEVRGRIRLERLTGPVQVTGPFDRRAGRVTAAHGGALLLGDAADFFDPFTGEGICAALRGAELAAAAVLAPLLEDREITRGPLRRYRRARRRAFAGKWIVERVIGYGMLAPALFDRTVARLERRGLSHTVIGVTGDFVPARAVLNPRFLSRVVF